MNFSLPERVSEVIRRLESFGGQAYLVGGCVRDQLLGRDVRDYDLLTDLTVERVQEIFPASFSFRSHQTTVVLKEKEVKIELSSLNGRNLTDDLQSRDLTINALAYAPATKELFDPTGGYADLKAGVLRSYDWDRAVESDPLRMLRALRFQAELGFSLDKSMLAVCREKRKLIKRMSAERVREELYHILLSPRAALGLRQLLSTGLLDFLLPELAVCAGLRQNEYHLYDVFDHTLAVVEKVPPQKELRLAALMHDLGKAVTVSVDGEGKRHFYGHDQSSVVLAEAIRVRLKLYDLDFDRVFRLIRHHMYCYVPEVTTDRALRRLLCRLGRELITDFTALRKADIIGTGCYTDTDLQRETELHERLQGLNEQGAALNEGELAWSRIERQEFLQRSGLTGQEFGQLKQELLEWVLDHPEGNQSAKLLARAEYLLALWKK